MSERLDKAVQLVDWLNNEPEVRLACVTVCAKHDCGSIGMLANEYPEVFDELYDGMQTMMAELPHT